MYYTTNIWIFFHMFFSYLIFETLILDYLYWDQIFWIINKRGGVGPSKHMVEKNQTLTSKGGTFIWHSRVIKSTKLFENIRFVFI